jgi:hypothetical protein
MISYRIEMKSSGHPESCEIAPSHFPSHPTTLGHWRIDGISSQTTTIIRTRIRAIGPAHTDEVVGGRLSVVDLARRMTGKRRPG